MYNRGVRLNSLSLTLSKNWNILGERRRWLNLRGSKVNTPDNPSDVKVSVTSANSLSGGANLNFDIEAVKLDHARNNWPSVNGGSPQVKT